MKYIIIIMTIIFSFTSCRTENCMKVYFYTNSPVKQVHSMRIHYDDKIQITPYISKWKDTLAFALILDGVDDFSNIQVAGCNKKIKREIAYPDMHIRWDPIEGAIIYKYEN